MKLSMNMFQVDFDSALLNRFYLAYTLIESINC
jgi:hypothetical protein